MSRLTVCFSIYSLMSMRMSGSGVSNSWFASWRTSSVLPTPVGPTKMKLAGRRLPERSARARFMARATASTASSWPMMRFFSSLSRFKSFANSLCSTFMAGMPVHSSTTLATSCISTLMPPAFS